MEGGIPLNSCRKFCFAQTVLEGSALEKRQHPLENDKEKAQGTQRWSKQ